jgi:coenzyme PQQ precursor peptide PqqA
MPPGRLGTVLGRHTTNKEIKMTWEIPTAVEMRFGMEITMYVYSR